MKMRNLQVWAWVFGLCLTGLVSAEEEDGGAAAASEEAVKQKMQDGVETGARRNITLGAMYCEEFKQQEGVQTLKNGIMYMVVATGMGKTPKKSDWINVN